MAWSAYVKFRQVLHCWNIRHRHATNAPHGHFYSPVVDIDQIERDAQEIFRPGALNAGLAWPSQPHIDFVRDVIAAQISTFAFPDQPDPNGVWRYHCDNPGFGWLDAIALYCLLRARRPRRIVEIGSGYSTALMLDTLRMDAGPPVSLTSIDPYPGSLVRGLHDANFTLLECRAQEADPAMLDELDDGDILFVDSSHVAKTGSDVNTIFFKFLPRLRPGVLVHFHDIYLPDEYPREWAVEQNRSWNEQYLLAAFLSGNRDYAVEFGCHFAATRLADILAPVLASSGRPLMGGGSFWIARRV